MNNPTPLGPRMKNRKIFPFEIVLIFCALSLLFFSRMPSVPLEEDEIYFITTSSQLEEWVNLETDAESWQINYWTLSAPALPKYIIAIGRLLGGYQRDELLIPYDNTTSYQENVLAGNVPSDKLLMASRVPMIILAVLSGILIYALLLKEIGRVAAIVWLGLFASNPSLDRILFPAMSEPPLLFFSVLAFVLFTMGLKRLHYFLERGSDLTKVTRIYLPFCVAGLSLGLAAASKIHAFMFLLPFGVLLLYSIFVPNSPVPAKSKITYLIRMFGICALSALITFVFLNPSIYLHPIKGLGWMLQFRINAMEWQIPRNPQFVSIPIFQRWINILQDLVTTNASIRGSLGLYINSVLGLAGLTLLVRSFISSVKRRLPLELLPSIMVYFSIMIIAAFMSPLDWLRYFLFPIIGLMILISYGAAFLMEKVRWVAMKKSQKPQVDSSTSLS